MNEIYLREPPQYVKDWISEHVPATDSTTTETTWKLTYDADSFTTVWKAALHAGPRPWDSKADWDPRRNGDAPLWSCHVNVWCWQPSWERLSGKSIYDLGHQLLLWQRCAISDHQHSEWRRAPSHWLLDRAWDIWEVCHDLHKLSQSWDKRHLGHGHLCWESRLSSCLSWMLCYMQMVPTAQLPGTADA